MATQINEWPLSESDSYSSFQMRAPSQQPEERLDMQECNPLSQQLQQALDECARLREENARLRSLLRLAPEPATGAPKDLAASAEIVSGALTPDAKIALFRSLFRGREDVYALRWESRNGRTGYAPACVRQWEQDAAGRFRLKADAGDRAPRIILATGRYAGEGFDDPRLDTLLLAMPISWHGTLQQYVGCLHRMHDRKRIVRVYDYVDGNVPVLLRMYERRVSGYQAIGYSIEGRLHSM
jgi:hypothetical protein